MILASTNLLASRIAAGCLAVALLVVLFVAKNVSIARIEISSLVPMWFTYKSYDSSTGISNLVIVLASIVPKQGG